MRKQLLAAAAALILGGSAAAIGAAPSALAQGCPTGQANCVTGTLQISGIISFTVNQTQMTFTGTPGAAQTSSTGTVPFSVTSNDPAGYTVTVTPGSANFDDGNGHTFGVNYLDVWGQQQKSSSNPQPAPVGQYNPAALAATGITTTQTSAPSASGGDSWTDTYGFLANTYAVGTQGALGLGIPVTPPGNYQEALQYAAIAR